MTEDTIVDFNDKDCLRYWPFEGDFGAPGDRVLKDKIGIARKSGPCEICEHDIQPGERIRMLSAVFDGSLMSYRWCSTCCAAMAAIRQNRLANLCQPTKR